MNKNLDTITNFKKNFLAELDKFYQCYQGARPDIISALCDKLHHMAFVIGSPTSIDPMLKSIASGKIKYWGGDAKQNRFETDRRTGKCSDRGHQLKGLSLGEMGRRFNEVLSGHFRWNFGAYMVDRETRDYINDFWFNPEFKATPSKSRMKEIIAGSTKIVSVGMFSSHRLIVNTKNYRWVYDMDTNGRDSATCNIGDGSVTTQEMLQLQKMAKKMKKDFKQKV